MSARKSESGPSPLISARRAGRPFILTRLVNSPSRASSSVRSSFSTRVSFEKAVISPKRPRGPSTRSMVRSVWPSPLARSIAPATVSAAGWPSRSAPSSSRPTASLLMLTATGSCGRANSRASGRGGAGPAPLPGRRGRITRSALSSSISTRRASSAVRVHCIAPFSSVSHTPLSSAIVSRSNVAREESAPRNPSITTCRPAPDSFSSRKRVRKPRSSSASREISAALSGAAVPGASGMGVGAGDWAGASPGVWACD